jgi:alkanesulfonate monooxygenase SsuD/methylene tetrahydromethanopterin reductase-like flavin-dependent oxidoreductase (luciferase family)
MRLFMAAIVGAPVRLVQGAAAERQGGTIVKVGLFLNTQFQPGQNVAAHLPDLVAQTRAARDAGFKSLWFPHHYLTGPLQMLQIVPMMAYLAPYADGMQIGPNILILPLLNPVHVAEESATLDVLTGGNYVLGVGLGYRAGEFTAFNMSLRERAPRLEESIALIRRLWSGEKVTHKGRFYEVNDHAIGLKPVRDGGPPIWMAGTAEAAIRRAARMADAWMIVPSTPLAELVGQMRIYREALSHRVPDCFPIVRECYVGASHHNALEECRAALQYKYDAYASWGLSGRQNPAFEDLARDRFIIGDAAFVKEEIARYREALGVDHFMMRCHWPGLEFEKALGSIRRLGEMFA